MYTRDRYSSTGLTRAAFTKKTLGVGNLLTGFGATISGGEDNNAASDYATISGGIENFVGGDKGAVIYYGTVGGGYSNEVYSTNGTVSGGINNIVSGNAASVAGGQFNLASGAHSWIPGGFSGNTRKLIGAHAYGSDVDAPIHTLGMQLWAVTENDTPAVLTANNLVADETNCLILRNATVGIVVAECVAVDNDSGDAYSVTLKATVRRGIDEASTTIIGAVTSVEHGVSVGFAPLFTLVADTVLGAIHVQFTGVIGVDAIAGAEITIREIGFLNGTIGGPGGGES
jgi:hypothetical protein